MTRPHTLGAQIPGIGHNSGAVLGRSWRAHCWRKARVGLIGRRLPIEVVRRRVARAQDLGLAYPQYAAILAGSGRDVIGFLFTCDGMGLRLARRLEMPETVQQKLSALRSCTLAAFSPDGEQPGSFRTELQQVAGVAFASCGPAPAPRASWTLARARLSEILVRADLPADGVVLIGADTDAVAPAWAEAAGLARFLTATEYFAPHR